ncbi:TIGR04282 family arsenosugar biosynthesis glycosyltransferase [Fundidesulfovibrio agrisoli]|uniref:TIGR04282 family arsenosugar biosynthesis glycosyltransferase n=1 Tax=Fundidesulfovibrio agrisoli TaxID=2922717 RepID=UPI001FADBBE1|nr:TIGR04282 family arsenosugar biosynthesis glycosyltransferase [Fundidesulfovibrio agrisoli]
MLRAPRLGCVKTRLAAHLGDEAALALYRACVEDMLEALHGCGADVIGFVDPADALEEVRRWLPSLSRVIPQEGTDLGRRLHNAFAWAFAQGYASAAALGSDLPGLTARRASQLCRLLRSEPALIGPSPDGGYWTVGFKAARYLPVAFDNIPWSTPEVFEATKRVLTPLEPAQLPPLADLDTVEDLEALLREPPEGAGRRTLAIAQSLPRE